MALPEGPAPCLGKLVLPRDPLRIPAVSLLPRRRGPVVAGRFEPGVALGVLWLPLVFWK